MNFTITYGTLLFRAIDDALGKVPCQTREGAEAFQALGDEFAAAVGRLMRESFPQLEAALKQPAQAQHLSPLERRLDEETPM
jgi:hypothetical protein